MEAAGAEVTLVSVAPVNADMVQALNTAAQSDPDVVIALTADSGCKPTMQTAQQLGLDVPIMYTGACAAPKILDSVGDAAEGAIFNLEAELGDSPDNVVYQAVSDRYGAKYDYEAQGAGTVAFRATINLYAQLRELGAEGITPDAILAVFRGRGRRAELLRTPLHVRRRAARRLSRVLRATAVAGHGEVR